MFGVSNSKFDLEISLLKQRVQRLEWELVNPPLFNFNKKNKYGELIESAVIVRYDNLGQGVLDRKYTFINKEQKIIVLHSGTKQ